MRRSWVWAGIVFHTLPSEKNSHAHDELAGFEDGRMDVLVDHALVAVGGASHFHMLRLGEGDEPRGASPMGRGAVEIVFCRIGGIVARESDFLRSHRDIETIARPNGMLRAIHGDHAGTSDIDDSHLPTLEEEGRAQLFCRRER